MVCSLEKLTYKEEEEISFPKLMQANKILGKHTAQALLSTESKNKRYTLYNMNKIFPLTKSAILIFFNSVCSIVLMDKEGSHKSSL